MSGGVTGTFTCVANAGWASNMNLTGIDVTVIQPPAGLQSAVFGGSVTGQLQPGTYSDASGFTQWATGLGYGPQTTENWGSSNMLQNGGTLTIAITGDSVIASTSTGIAYTPHGSLDALVQPAAPGSTLTPVTVHVDF
jgi:hypothetical protein